MFVAEALYPFSSIILKESQQYEKKQDEKKDKLQQSQSQDKLQQKKYDKLTQPSLLDPQYQSHIRERSLSQQNQLNKISNQSQNNKKVHCYQSQQSFDKPQKGNLQKKQKKQQQKAQDVSIQYLTFQAGDKILVKQAYQNGWWYGNTIKNPQFIAFFPSNYVKVGSKPPPPPPQKNEQQQQEQQEEEIVYNPYQDGAVDWVSTQLKKVQKGPVQSAYYLGIKGYKNVKIDDKNQNILKGDHVKFDVSTGLARVPIKDQAPAAKAVRQMGYYFDYHQWCEARNKTPDFRARPDASKKKKKKLNLKFMN